MTFGKPVPGVQIVERKRKIHEEKKNEGRLSERLEQAMTLGALPTVTSCICYSREF